MRDEIALDAARLEVGPERRDDEGEVDVGGERLRGRGQAGGVAHESAAARQHAPHQSVPEADPVADRDVQAVVHLPAGQAGADCGFGRPDVVGAAMNGRDAARHEAGLQVFGELVVPAELVQIESRQRKAPSQELGRHTRPEEERPAL